MAKAGKQVLTVFLVTTGQRQRDQEDAPARSDGERGRMQGNDSLRPAGRQRRLARVSLSFFFLRALVCVLAYLKYYHWIDREFGRVFLDYARQHPTTHHGDCRQALQIGGRDDSWFYLHRWSDLLSPFVVT